MYAPGNCRVLVVIFEDLFEIQAHVMNCMVAAQECIAKSDSFGCQNDAVSDMRLR
jgi:hypothetical protein